MEDNTLDFFDLDGYESPQPLIEPEETTEEVETTEEITEEVEDTTVVVEEPETPEEDSVEDEDETLKLNYEYLKGLGALHLPEDYQFKATEKGFEEAIKASNDNLQKALFDGLFEDMPEEGKALLNYYANGGTNVKEFVSLHSRPNYSKVDLDDETAQEAIVRESLKRTTKFTDAKIEREIEALRYSFRLREAAEEGQTTIAQMDAEERAALAERAKLEAVEQEKAVKAEIAELSKTIKSVKEVNGIPLSDKDEALVINSLYKPIKLTDGTKTTSFNYKLNQALADPKKRALLAKLVETDFDFSYLARKTKTEAAISLKDRLKETKRFGSGRTGSSSGFDSDSATLNL